MRREHAGLSGLCIAQMDCGRLAHVRSDRFSLAGQLLGNGGKHPTVLRCSESNDRTSKACLLQNQGDVLHFAPLHDQPPWHPRLSDDYSASVALQQVTQGGVEAKYLAFFM